MNIKLPNSDRPDDDARLRQYEAAAELSRFHLKRADDLDFTGYNNQRWASLYDTYASDVLVHWPDGRLERGLKLHIRELQALFAFAPDTRVKFHSVRIAAGDWTSVIGIMQGTFSRPMPAPGGESIPPTGKAFRIEMCTVAHWDEGLIDEEYRFWDNLALMRQIGLAT